MQGAQKGERPEEVCGQQVEGGQVCGVPLRGCTQQGDPRRSDLEKVTLGLENELGERSCQPEEEEAIDIQSIIFSTEDEGDGEFVMVLDFWFADVQRLAEDQVWEKS